MLRLRRGHSDLQDRLRDLSSKDAAATTDPVILEVLRGTRNEADFIAMRQMLGALRYLPVTRQQWDAAARLGYELRQAGFAVPSPDLLIAAVAIGADAVLVHADTDFEVIARTTSLVTEVHLTHHS